MGVSTDAFPRVFAIFNIEIGFLANLDRRRGRDLRRRYRAGAVSMGEKHGSLPPFGIFALDSDSAGFIEYR